MNRYGLVRNGVVDLVVESQEAPAGWTLLPAGVGPGWGFDGANWTAPVAPVDPCEWLIDIGPFFDRFGASKVALLSSSNATVRALVADVQVRKWIDLKRADVATALDLLISAGLITAAQKTAILTAPVTAEENRALRKLYF